MGVQIIADSCCDLPQALQQKLNVTLVPLKIVVDGQTYVDDGGITPRHMLDMLERSPTGASTACPSPQDYLDAMTEDDVLVVTLSSQLSGSYQSACTARQLRAGGRTHVFDSKSASAGQVLLVLQLHQWMRQGLGFEQLVERGTQFLDSMKTYFVLQSLDHMIKAGRISRLVGQVASLLHMRPIMGGDPEGKIVLVEKARGTARAMEKLAALLARRAEELRDGGQPRGDLVIAHCQAMEHAKELKRVLHKKCKWLTNIVIVPTGGLSTTYAGAGGIITAY